MKTNIKGLGILVFILVFMPILWTSMFSSTEDDYNFENALENRLAGLRDKLHQMESLNREREADIHNLRNQVQLLLGSHLNNNMSMNGGVTIDEETRQKLANMTLGSSDLSAPTMYHYLPHLIGKPEGLQPSIKVSQGRTGVSIVIGIPTIKRSRESYLMTTLKSLVDNMKTEEKEESLIVVFIAEPYDLEFCKTVAMQINNTLPEEINSGLIEVIASPAQFYPDLNMVRETFGDTKERVKWRTKQNLDYSFLMMYAKSRGTYYVQMEDDVIAKESYIKIMKNFALNQKSDDWMLLEFSHLGFIGKMFKSSDLPFVVEFFLMFYRDKPIDWLLDHLLTNKVCNPEKDMKHCQRSVAELRRRFKPSLFQHIGTHSSLLGKVQKLKDRDFGKSAKKAKRSHINPNADVSSTIKIYQRFSLEKAYLGDNIFWGLIPKASDIIQFHFNPPVRIEKYLFQSGNSEHPGDKLFNTSVEIFLDGAESKLDGPLDNQKLEKYASYNRTKDGFLIMSWFNHATGIARGEIPETFGPVSHMRLQVHSEGTAWVLLNEITIFERDQNPKKSPSAPK